MYVSMWDWGDSMLQITISNHQTAAVGYCIQCQGAVETTEALANDMYASFWYDRQLESISLIQDMVAIQTE